MAADRKLAKDLAEGDRVVRGGYREVGIVRSVVEGPQIVRKTILIVTLELADGHAIHATYAPNSTVLLDPQP